MGKMPMPPFAFSTKKRTLFACGVALFSFQVFFIGATEIGDPGKQPSGAVDLAGGFANPPASARPSTWFLWSDGKISKEGVTRDLEEMASKGIRQVLIDDYYTALGIEKGPIVFLSPEWMELFRHALAEANRIGLVVVSNFCSGFDSGGPWIDAAHASQKLIWSEKLVEGSAKIDEVLPMPAPVVDNFYRDSAVVAFRVPQSNGDQDSRIATATQSTEKYHASATRAIDGDTASNFDHGSTSLTRDEANPWWLLDLGKETAVEALEIWPGGPPGSGSLNHADVILLDAGKNGIWRKNVGTIKEPSLKLPVEIPAPAPKARYVRIEKKGGNVSLAEVRVYSAGRNIALAAGSNRMPGWDAKAVRLDLVYMPPEITPPGRGGSDALPDVEPGTVVDLTSRMTADGRLQWDAPEGNWMILRFGHSPQGGRAGMVKGSNPGGGGYELDQLNPDAMDIHFKSFNKKLLDVAGPLVGKTFRSFWIESMEVGLPNWTARFREEFQKRRGYDLLPYLPVLAGRIVENIDVSERFLWDYRRTIGDLFTDNYYARAAELCHENGVGFEAEAYGSYFDSLQAMGRLDVPWGEFWAASSNPPESLAPFLSTNGADPSVRAASSAAHIYGKNVANAESFTSYEKWIAPSFWKAYADRVFCEGINQINHAYLHQPALDDKPGMIAVVPGTNRNITWWEQSPAWFDYLARSSFLLQQGRHVADLCYFMGEGVPYPMYVEYARVPPGYQYDQLNAEVLLTRMSVKDGKLVLPDGMSYRLLILPEAVSMTPHVLRKIAELVEAGANVVGPKPTQSPGLEKFPACDKEVRELADKVWGPCDGKTVKEHSYGKGKVFWGMRPQEILLSLGVKPDFEAASGQDLPIVNWIHRNDQGADIYFVANLRNRPEELEVSFRVSGKAPELWHPDTGKITRPAVYDEVDGRTKLPLRLDPLGSAFVVFRDPAKSDRIVSLAKDGKTLFPGGSWPAKETPLVEVVGDDSGAAMKIWEAGKYDLKTAAGEALAIGSGPMAPPLEITGPWEVTFPAGLGAPAAAGFDRLVSWSEHPEAGIKYFSGTATYVKEIEVPEELAGKQLYLDLGKVKELAEVRLNGKDLGVLWKPPFRVDLSQAVKPGKNLLEVKVTNLWTNRLIGDEFLPEADRITRVNKRTFTKESPLRESGLLGPVLILPVENRRLETKKLYEIPPSNY